MVGREICYTQGSIFYLALLSGRQTRLTARITWTLCRLLATNNQPMKDRPDWTMERPPTVFKSQLWCVVFSAIAFIAWARALLFADFALYSTDSNSLGAGILGIAPFVLALPFGVINAITVYSAILRFFFYDFTKSRNVVMAGLLLSTAIGLAWYFAIRSSANTWRNYGLAWALYTTFVPSAFMGMCCTAFFYTIFKKRDITGR